MTALDATGLFRSPGGRPPTPGNGQNFDFMRDKRTAPKADSAVGTGAHRRPRSICENVREALRRADEVFEELEAKAAVSGN